MLLAVVNSQFQTKAAAEMMGLRLIQQVLLAEDGIRNKTPLTKHVMNHFNNDVDANRGMVEGAIPKDYGQFSPVLFQWANEGDELAIEMLKQTAADIEMFVLALHRKGANRCA